MKKGFTLVELLAVIVILAIIALITVPIIMNIVESSKKATSVESANGYVRAVTNYLIMNVVDDGVYSVFDSNIKAEYTGTKVSNGSITIEKGDIKKANLCINDYSIDYINGVSSISNNDYCKDMTNKILVLNKNGKQLKSIYIGESTNILIDTNDIDMNDVRNMSCNNGVVLTEENGNILINNILGNTNCYLNNTLFNAINNSDTTENNILLLQDEENVSVIIENKKITLNMNGKKLKGNENIIYVKKQGDLTINGEGIISSNSTNTSSSNGVIKMYGNSNAKLTINASNCDSMNPEEYTSGFLMYSDGINTISNGGLSLNDMDTMAELNINGGCYYSKQRNAIQIQGNTNAVINNSKISASLKGITVAGTKAGICKITLINNDIISQNDAAFFVNESSSIDIDGGTYTSLSKNQAVIIAYEDATLDIKDAIIRQETTSDYYWTQIGIRSDGTSKINLENVDVKSKGLALYVNSGGIINVKSGTFESDGFDDLHDSVAAVNSEDGSTINICGGTFKTFNKEKVYDLSLFGGAQYGSRSYYIKYKSNGINWINGTEPSKSYEEGLENHFVVDDTITCE